MSTTVSVPRRGILLSGLAAGAGALAAACTSNDTKSATQVAGGTGDNSAAGTRVRVAFSAPAADHGWTAAITRNARAQAEKFSDLTLDVTEGTNDVSRQIEQVQTMINQKADVLVILPFDGNALTEIAKNAMAAGIPVINLDRVFASALAYRTWIGGDNYGMGVNAGNFIIRKMKDAGRTDPVIVEVAGIDNLQLTQERSRGFHDALAAAGFRVTARQSTDFTAAGGQQVASQMLQATKKIDAMWNHDDDQGIGVLAAIKQADRSGEFVMVGGGGSAQAMREIQSGNSPLQATVLYSPAMASSAVALARLLGQRRALGDLAEHDVPAKITTFSAVVTKDNAEQYLTNGY
ncbi:monosaccharide ABC transporter substrate-binding protein (CUT2 family) [Nocardia tenerifensis]|uniref:Monosaccharide ABC transporter substrate-binding protein (CUT2 family) n=1 Tax=Nocardia tenerifensis TaxID=228006 RepID=A0A318KG43_9NOCA|nr:substrate-binding domain-containing protein [Nocardia tenerifensis]PXX71143.1 monosaccharide ABC transporter substrate-binding protein (CUT2 family) [Nocardia tenerifensis]